MCRDRVAVVSLRADSRVEGGDLGGARRYISVMEGGGAGQGEPAAAAGNLGVVRQWLVSLRS